jgi:isopentenyl phosphate kinase
MNPPLGKLSEFLDGLAKLFNPPRRAEGLEGSAPIEATEKAQDAEALAKQLDEAVAKVKESAEQLRHETGGGAFAAENAQRKASDETRRAEQERAVREAHVQIWKEILLFHESLNTGLGEQALSADRMALQEVDEILAGKRFHGIEQAVRAAVMRRLLAECKGIGWHLLRQRMEERGMSWPDPGGLSPWADEKEIARARQRELAEIEEEFKSASAGRSSDRMCGVVSAWKAYYPSPDSSPWKRTVIEAVGHGIFAHLLAAATREARDAEAGIKATFAELSGEQLIVVQGALEKGVHSASEADELLRAVRHISEDVVPELVWNRVQAVVYATAEQIAVGTV